MNLAVCAGTLAGVIDMCFGAHVGSLAIGLAVLLFPTKHPVNHPERMCLFFLIAESIHLGLLVWFGSFDWLRLTPPPSGYEICVTLVICVCVWLVYWLLPIVSFGKPKQSPPQIRKVSTPTPAPEESNNIIIVDCFL